MGRSRSRRALRIALQIAEALEAAHEKSIIHRDLKPANVKITPDDKVKVLDFGLAKTMEAEPARNVANSPTLSMMATNAGIILGTAAYMSPEQAKGFAADHRSDVFSFGVVLYEMLTGRQPFQGETAPDVLASVLIREPELQRLPADLNPRIPDLLRRCLEKSPKRRWQAIGDLRAEIEAVMAAPRVAASPVLAAAPAKPLWRRAVPVAARVTRDRPSRSACRLAAEASAEAGDHPFRRRRPRRAGVDRSRRKNTRRLARRAEPRVHRERQAVPAPAVEHDGHRRAGHGKPQERRQSRILPGRTAAGLPTTKKAA